MTEELKPCPFCGNDDIQDWGESTWSRPVKWMYCTECQAHGPRVMLERNEEETAWLQRAIAAWNNRATTAALEVPDGLIDALRSGEQADMDGTMVKVSRQACEQAADLLAALAALEGGDA